MATVKQSLDAAPTPSTPLTPSWELLPKNLQLVRRRLEQVAVISILPGLFVNLAMLVGKHNEHQISSLQLTLLGAGCLWVLVNLAATSYLQVTAARGKWPSTAACYKNSWRYWWRIVVFLALFSILLGIGFLLLIVPGLIVLRRYILTPFYIIDQDLSVKEAMRRSAAQTKIVSGYVWGTLGVVIVMSLGAGLISQMFGFVPGLPAVISSILGVSFYFVMALRYVEVANTVPLPSTEPAAAEASRR